MAKRDWTRCVRPGVTAAVLLLAALLMSCAPKADTVVVHDLEFDPAVLTVPVGTIVTWTVDEETAVLPLADNGEFTAPKPLNPGESWSFKFEKAGTFTYSDKIQPYCTGTIIVK